MNITLQNKKAIVTGSSTGMGFAIAKSLTKAGASVLLTGRSEGNVAEAVDRIKNELPNASVEGIAADLSSLHGTKQLIDFWPDTDIIINNLGVFGPKPFFELTEEDWDTYIQTNLMASARLSQHYAKGMRDRKWGRILFNGSVTAGFHNGEMVHYGATKAALFGLSRGLAEYLANTGVTVNTYIPGPTRTERVGSFMDELAKDAGKTTEEFEGEMFQASMPSSLIQRFVTPEEVANLVTFLASEQSSAITGASMRVDGGIVRYPL